MANTVTLPIRKVHKTLEGDYIVLEKKSGKWESVTKRYNYLTSAYAALGRLTAPGVM